MGGGDGRVVGGGAGRVVGGGAGWVTGAGAGWVTGAAAGRVTGEGVGAGVVVRPVALGAEAGLGLAVVGAEVVGAGVFGARLVEAGLVEAGLVGAAAGRAGRRLVHHAAGWQLILLRQAAPDRGLFRLLLGGLDLGDQRGQLALNLGQRLLASRHGLGGSGALDPELRQGGEGLLVGGRQLLRLAGLGGQHGAVGVHRPALPAADDLGVGHRKGGIQAGPAGQAGGDRGAPGHVGHQGLFLEIGPGGGDLSVGPDHGRPQDL